MNLENCSFCNIALSPQPKAWEDEFFYVLYDLHPVNPGHTLLIPKNHIEEMLGLSIVERSAFWPALEKVVTLIEKTDFRLVYEGMLKGPQTNASRWFLTQALQNPHLNTKPDGYNFGINDGTAAGRTVDHLHCQIIPRFIGDVEDPRGGVRFVVPAMGNYKLPRSL